MLWKPQVEVTMQCGYLAATGWKNWHKLSCSTVNPEGQRAMKMQLFHFDELGQILGSPIKKWERTANNGYLILRHFK